MGKYDLWNKNTKKWADKYGAKIIKKYPKYGCVHEFYMEVSSSSGFPTESFRCFAAAPSTGNKDGDVVVLIDRGGCGFCVLGNNINKFLKEYSKKVLAAKSKLLLKYHSVSQYKDPPIPKDTKDDIIFVLKKDTDESIEGAIEFTFDLGDKDDK